MYEHRTDALLPLRYDADSPQGKLAIRQRLGQALGLRERPQALLFGAVTRLSEQKGLQLLPPVLDALVAQGGQLVVLGSGDTAQEAALRAAMDRHPGDCVLCTGHDEPLAHQIMAAATISEKPVSTQRASPPENMPKLTPVFRVKVRSKIGLTSIV